MRTAVVGCGYWGSKHVRVLHSILGSEQVVLCDPRQERLSSLKSSYPGVTTFTSVDDALDSIDAAIIAVPPSAHAPLASRLMRAGKHVLVEKPLALRVDDALGAQLHRRRDGGQPRGRAHL